MKVNFTKSSDALVIIGTSAGGIHALKSLFQAMQPGFRLPLVVAIHRLKNVKSHMESVLQASTDLLVKEAEEKEFVKPGHIYLTPANYHLLIEEDKSISLSVDELVNFSRPSIDVSFVSASEVYGPNVIGIVLTGANADGAKGLQRISENGGVAIVQDPSTAQVDTMPSEALKMVPDAKVLTLENIAAFLNNL
ncbi:MAG: chemotaxis protein CheB [Owenweeksia sp.]